MILARGTGRTTNGYLLSGVIIGLLFSAIQTAMIKFMGHKVSNSMAWLFGSFANVSLTQAMIVIVAMVVLVTLLMRKAKELNLEFNQKTQIVPLSEGVDFLGFRFYLTDTGKVVRRLRTSNKRRWKRRLKKYKVSKRWEWGMPYSPGSRMENPKSGRIMTDETENETVDGHPDKPCDAVGLDAWHEPDSAGV